MVSHSKQDWSTGSTVKAGFMTLTVIAKIPTPGDFKPDAYVLKNSTGTQLYSFVPHNGLEKISLLEAREMIADAKAHADRTAAAAIAKSQEAARRIAEINELVFA